MGDNGISHPSCDFFCANMFEQYISPRDGVAFEHHIAPKPSMQWQIQSNSGYVTLPPIFYPFNMFGFRLGCLPSKRIQKASLPIQLTLMFYPPPKKVPYLPALFCLPTTSSGFCSEKTCSQKFRPQGTPTSSRQPSKVQRALRWRAAEDSGAKPFRFFPVEIMDVFVGNVSSQIQWNLGI